MQQVDFAGAPEPKAFRDIPNVRAVLAEEKAVLLRDLGRLITSCPPMVRDGGVETVRQWRTDAEACRKVAGNSRSSKNELSAALNRMQKWWKA